MCFSFEHLQNLIWYYFDAIVYYDIVADDGDVAPPTVTTMDVKETLFDLSEALECATGEGGVEKCQQTQQQFREKRQSKRIKLTTITDPSITGGEEEVGDTEMDKAKKPTIIQDGHELSMFDHVVFEAQVPRDTRPKASGPDPTKLATAEDLLKAMNNPPPREYPQMYYGLEFLPYNPIPERLDAMLLPFKENPLPLYDDPYWPTKRECLSLLGLRDKGQTKLCGIHGNVYYTRS